MAESDKSISNKEKIDREVELITSEDLFCRKCVRYFATKSEFCQHIQKHIEETSDGISSYMSYIEKYICSTCGKTFEVKSDLIIHYNTVCFDAPYTCKHCKENCENSPFLQMHLLFHHNYSEEMLRDEGFLADFDDKFSPSNYPFMGCPRRKALLPSSELGEEHFVDNSTLAETSGSYDTSRKSEVNGKDIAFNLLDKVHSCEICNESFSRKCVLDIHKQKHFMKRRKKRTTRNISAKFSTLTSCDNNFIRARYAPQNIKSVQAAELTGQEYNSQRAILKPSNAVIGSSIWKKVIPKREFLRAKRSVITKRALRSKKIPDSECKEQYSSNRKAILNSTNEVEPVTRKKVKHKINIQGVSVKQKAPETSNTTTQSKSGKTESPKKNSKNEGAKVYTCDSCKRKFNDSYKLKRHSFIHTGERPYSCTKCKKTFTRDDHLKRHFKRVCSKIKDAK